MTAKTYFVTRDWGMADTVSITANSLEDAYKEAYKLPLSEGVYIDDSLTCHIYEDLEDGTPSNRL